jgi:hypothetical protein
MLLVFLMDIEIWLIGREAHGLNANYSVLKEAPMADGVEYWIAAGILWAPWRDSERRGPMWMSDARDKQSIAPDGSLKEIKRRKWIIYNVNLPTGSKRIPKDLTPDWIMTWSAEDGIHTDPVSDDAKGEVRAQERASN